VLIDYPDIKLEVNIDNGFRNIVEEGFDAGIRLGESVEKDMIAVRIGPDWRLVAVASPGYLKAHPAPFHPEELIGHTCINHRHLGTGGLYAWEFEKNGQDLRVRVDGQLAFNSSHAMIDAALNCYGIAYVPEDTVLQHISAGGRGSGRACASISHPRAGSFRRCQLSLPRWNQRHQTAVAGDRAR
jgi:DNA-binding transcriptional LysR family regulator